MACSLGPDGDFERAAAVAMRLAARTLDAEGTVALAQLTAAADLGAATPFEVRVIERRNDGSALVEVPVMLSLVAFANHTRSRFA